MKIIEELCDKIEDQLTMAEKYTMCALTYKEEYPALADTYYRIATEQLAHMNLLHTQIVSIIENYKKSNGEPPQAMTTLYDILHRRYIAHATSVKGMLALYKE